MIRPGLYIGFPFVLGLVLASAAASDHWFWAVGGVALAAAAVLVWQKRLWKYVVLSTLSCLTACCVYWNADRAYSQQQAFAGQETVFTGSVYRRIVYDSGFARYDLEGTFPDGTRARVELFLEDADYPYGETLTITGTPEMPEQSALFDGASYARAQGVSLTFEAETQVTSHIPPEKPTLRSIVHNWREEMLLRIRARMGRETGEMLTGLLFGDRTGMSRESRTALNRTGLGHVLVVSGLHFDFLAVCAAWLLKKLTVPVKPRFVLMTVLCGLYVIAAGETIPVWRACILILIAQFATVIFREPDALNSLSIAAFLITLVHPFAIHGASFWMSFIAAWAAGVAAPFMTKNMKRSTTLKFFAADIASALWIFAVLLPVSAVCFREVSLLSPLSNLLLVPVCFGAMLLGAAALLFGCEGAAGTFLLDGADVMTGWILEISKAAASVPQTHLSTGNRMLLPCLAVGCACVTAIFCVTKSRKYTGAAAVCAFLVTVTATQAVRLWQGESLRISMLGDAKSCLIVLTDGEEAAIVDMTGQTALPAYAEDYLMREGIHSVDGLYLCKPSVRSARRYEGYLGFYVPKRVYLLREKTDFPRVFDTEPEQLEMVEFLFHGAVVHVEQDAVTVGYAGDTCLFARDAQDVQGTPEVLAVLKEVTVPLPDCGCLILPGGGDYREDANTYIGETNLELTILQDGRCRMRRIYGESG